MSTIQTALILSKYFVVKAPATSGYSDKTLRLQLNDLTAAGIDNYDHTLSDIYVWLKVIAPDGTDLFKDMGYDTSSKVATKYSFYAIHGSPATTNFLKVINLPYDILGNIIQGDYEVVIKVSYLAGNGDAEVTYTQDYTYTLCYTRPTACISADFNTGASRLIAQDKTDFGTNCTVSSKLIAIYPPTLIPQKDNVTSTNKLLSISPIFTGYWTIEIQDALTYSYPHDFYIVDELDAVKPYNLDLDANICKAYCGMISLNKRYKAAQCNNLRKAEELGKQVFEVMRLWMLFNWAKNCVRGNDQAFFLEEMFEVGDFSEDCGCGCSDGSQSVEVIPDGSDPGNLISILGTNGVSVSEVEASGVTTFTIKFSDSYKAKIDALHNAAVAVTGTTLNMSPTTDADGNVTYTLSVPTNGIDSAQIKNSAVTAAKLAAGAVNAGVATPSMQSMSMTVPVKWDTAHDGTINVKPTNNTKLVSFDFHVTSVGGGTATVGGHLQTSQTATLSNGNPVGDVQSHTFLTPQLIDPMQGIDIVLASTGSSGDGFIVLNLLRQEP